MFLEPIYWVIYILPPTAYYNIGRAFHQVKGGGIAAKLGNDDALESLRGLGIRKEIFDDTLRGHQAAVDATKSQQRDAAEKYYEQRN